MDDPSNLDANGSDQGSDHEAEAEDLEDGAQAAADAAGDNPGEIPAGMDRPGTKGELQKLRERYSNTLRLVSHLYHDVSLKAEFRMVAGATRAYMKEYATMLDAQKHSQARLKNTPVTQ